MAQGSSNLSQNIAKVGGTAVSTNAGNADAGTQRIVLATNQSALPVSQSGTWTVQPGNTPNTAPWLIKVNDGTNSVAIKAASTAPVVVDPALVVSISPNTPTLAVSVASIPSHPVTNAGTFAVQAAQSGTWTVQPGNTPNTTPWLTRLSDGTNSVGIKAASTAAAATDPALVVAISPNNSVNVTQSTAENLNATVSIAAAQTLSTVTTVGTVSTVTNLSQLGGIAIAMNSGVRSTGTQRVTIATNDVVPTTGIAVSSTTTTAYAASLIAKASAGTLYTITGYNSKNTSQFIQIHDSATLPAEAAVPKIIFFIPPLTNFSYDMGHYGRVFAAGITICNSSTGPTKTIGAADCWLDVTYK